MDPKQSHNIAKYSGFTKKYRTERASRPRKSNITNLFSSTKHTFGTYLFNKPLGTSKTRQIYGTIVAKNLSNSIFFIKIAQPFTRLKKMILNT